MQTHKLAIIFLFSIPVVGMLGGFGNQQRRRPPNSETEGLKVDFNYRQQNNAPQHSLGFGAPLSDFGANPFARKPTGNTKAPQTTEVRAELPKVNIGPLQPTSTEKAPHVDIFNVKKFPINQVPAARFNYPGFMNFNGLPPKFDITPGIAYDPKFENSATLKKPELDTKEPIGKTPFLPTDTRKEGPKLTEENKAELTTRPNVVTGDQSPKKEPKDVSPIIKVEKVPEGRDGKEDFVDDSETSPKRPTSSVDKTPKKETKDISPIIKVEKVPERRDGEEDFTDESETSPKRPTTSVDKTPKTDSKRPGGLGDLIAGLKPKPNTPTDNELDNVFKTANIKPKGFTRSKSFAEEVERPPRDEKKPFDDSDADAYDNAFPDFSRLSFVAKSRGRRSFANSLMTSRNAPRASVVTLRSMNSRRSSYARGDPPTKRVTRVFMIERMACGNCLKDPFIKKMVARTAN